MNSHLKLNSQMSPVGTILHCAAPGDFQTLLIEMLLLQQEGKKGRSPGQDTGMRRATTFDLAGDPAWSLWGPQKLTLGEWKWAKRPFMILFQAHENSALFIMCNCSFSPFLQTFFSFGDVVVARRLNCLFKESILEGNNSHDVLL